MAIKTPQAEVQFQWDGAGHLVRRRVGEKVTHYLTDPLSPLDVPLVEFDRRGNLKSVYLYADTLLRQSDAAGRMRYFLEDGLIPFV